jgi:hypothetical protein
LTGFTLGDPSPTFSQQARVSVDVLGLAGAGSELAALKGAAGAARAGEAANEGIYVIRSQRGTYVGQSGNITERFKAHSIARGGRFTEAELASAERVEVPGGKTAREIAEQQKIDELGGVGQLLNVRNPIGPRRFQLMPQPYSRQP